MKKILERRKDALEENGKIEWALAESLAFASILQEGTPIRLTGNEGLLSWPEGFNVYPKVKKILERRKDALEENGKLNGHLLSH